MNPKTSFVVGFKKYLDHVLFWPMGNAPIFDQMKGLMEIHNPGKFHRYSICGFKVIYLQSFSNQQEAGFLAAFGWFLVDYNPKSSPICTKLSPVMQCKTKYHILHDL